MINTSEGSGGFLPELPLVPRVNKAGGLPYNLKQYQKLADSWATCYFW